MKVQNHRFADHWHKQTSNVSKNRTIDPQLIVLHYTTGWDYDANVNWLLGRAGSTDNAASSAHLVIARDGTVKQICPFNRRAWHAGPSRHRHWADVNSHGIGIEFLNPGWLKPDGRGGWIDYHGHRRTSAELEQYGGFMEARHPRVGGLVYAWPLYPREQIAAGLAACRALIDAYAIKAIVTHEDIDTRGWKTDPGPAFPLEAYVDLLDAQSPGADELVYRVDATRLNLRGGPGTQFEKIDPPGSLPWGTKVRPRRRVDGWVYVEVVDGGSGAPGSTPLLGWVNDDYLVADLGP